MPRRQAFTLVELLVVIGIIAVMISILLPVLGKVRKQSEATKCAAALREVGNAFQMYAIDNDGYFPPAQLRTTTAAVFYNIDGVDYPRAGVGAYWFNFIAKYVTKSKVGTASDLGFEAEDARRSVLWGCPTWLGYDSTTVGGVNRVQIGLGMNLWPTFSATNPRAPLTFPASAESSFASSWHPTNSPSQGFIRQTKWGKQAAERVLVADSRFWASESNPLPPNGQFPPQPAINNSETYTPGISGQTMIDVYRHGSRPPKISANSTAVRRDGGRVAYNLLHVDGHVTTEVTQRAAYERMRMRFPG